MPPVVLVKEHEHHGVGQQNTLINIKKNKTWTPYKTNGSEDEPNIVFMWKVLQRAQHEDMYLDEHEPC